MVVLTPGGLTIHWLQSWCWWVRDGIQAGPLSGPLSDGRFSCVWRWHTGLHACHRPHFIPRSFPALRAICPPCPQGKAQTPLNVQNLSNRSPPGFRDISILPECPLRWPLHRPIQVLTRGAHAHACTGVPPRGHGLRGAPPPCRHAGCYGAIF